MYYFGSTYTGTVTKYFFSFPGAYKRAIPFKSLKSGIGNYTSVPVTIFKIIRNIKGFKSVGFREVAKGPMQLSPPSPWG